MRRWVCLLWICLAFRQVYVSHIQRVLEYLFHLYYTQVLYQYRLYRADHAYLACLMLHRHLSHFNGRSLDHRQVWASYIICVWLHLVLYREHVHCHGFVWLQLVVCTILLYNRIYTEGWKLYVIPTVRRILFCMRCNFNRCLPLIPKRVKRKPLLLWSVPYGGLA
jgi:hypothetical protein